MAVIGLGAVTAAGIRDGRWADVGPVAALVWCVFSAAANLLPVPAGPNLYLSMSAPVNIAIAVVFAPAVAAPLVAAASFSEWELRGGARLSHAVFNRTQLALSAAAAGAVLHLRPIPTAWTLLAAVAAYHATNWLLVGTADRTARGTPVRAVVARVLPGGAVAAASYLALGAMGVALGLAGVRIGGWAVALLLIPLVGARQAVQASRDIERTERERRLLADRLIEERERERNRIASDLHDSVLQDLALLQVQADNVAAAAGRRDQRTVGLAASLRTAVDATIADVRSAVASLRRSVVDEDGLVVAIERYARVFGRQSGVDVTVTAHDADRVAVPAALALLLYECCQEALTNIGRHARATAARVEVWHRSGQLELRVHDDGVGFAPAEAGDGRSLGLHLTREKVSLWGGGCWVNSAPGAGTEVVIRVPLGAGS